MPHCRLQFCLCFLLGIAIAQSCSPSQAHAKDFYVYYLGGQSNMDGYGYSKELPEELAKPLDAVPIFHGNTSEDDKPVDGKGIWSTVRPGHGVGFKSDGKTNTYGKRFGVEVTFARAIRKQFPDRNIAIIKYSRGGTSIAAGAKGNYGCWEPDYMGRNGINQYDHFLATIRHAYADTDIDDDGEADRLIPAGIAWMQGESDATATVEIANKYEANLARLMNLIRAALRTDDLPVVIGRISYSRKTPPTWKHGEIVRAAQAAYAKNDSNAAIVTATDSYGYSDFAHYDSKGYIALGKEFADALAGLEKR